MTGTKANDHKAFMERLNELSVEKARTFFPGGINDAAWDHKRSEQITPLQFAIKFHDEGFDEFFFMLLKFPDIQVNAKDENGDTALHFAVEQKLQKHVEALLDAGADCRIKNNKGKTAMDFANEQGNQIIKKLLRRALNWLTL